MKHHHLSRHPVPGTTPGTAGDVDKIQIMHGTCFAKIALTQT